MTLVDPEKFMACRIIAVGVINASGNLWLQAQ